MAEKAWHQEFKAAGHIALAVPKQIKQELGPALKSPQWPTFSNESVSSKGY